MNRFLLFLSGVLVFTFATGFLAEPVQAQPPSGCTESTAMVVARKDKEVTDFCSAPINGVNYGCNFKIRLADERERKDSSVIWVVEASIIHSFDDKGQPRFMPEGAIFTYISKTCKTAGVLSPFKCKPRDGYKICS